MFEDRVTFAGTELDRAAHVRETQAALDAAWTHPQARVAAFWRGKPLLTEGEAPRTVWLDVSHPVLSHATKAPLFLGETAEGAPRFAHDLSSWDEPVADPEELAQFLDPSRNYAPGLPDGTSFGDMRANIGQLDRADAGTAATARGMLEWHRTHGFCARCGHETEIDKGGWARRCPSCSASHFPRTDPVVIMLITHGNDVLLGRSPGWPPRMYSLLAGFMEPGETLEAAVRREVREEAAIEVGEVRYIASQPWPFPASLMLGCGGVATSREITIDPVEMDDVIWVSRERCAAAMAGDDPEIVPARKGAIAHTLIDLWLRDLA
ncbi:NAD(+) diphosphatase [Pontivivens insulae]|uniref:NAD(+) diphosphatase n=1 Tax=Pontivivens insulae TaxID=1639689 RepID=A0A2R8ADQ8_9RHOB|nr:NAD(+) diphosphatase [Pontivivens insulae]RED14304.1 NAD+ diphosphatase [Pontivivens insulae]SPF30381.1 NADH pyrophosphatase [Pontivivens insulae]